jgi:outer membrane immunogenic protein
MRRALNRDRNKESKMGVALWAAESAARAIALLFAATSAALAADLPAPAPFPPPAYVPQVYNWTGFYIGGNIGAGWSGLSDTNTNFSDTLGSTFSAATNAQFLGGGQVGVNYEFANGIVIGAEAMFDWLANSQNATVTAADPSGAFAANIGTSNARWLTTVSGRLG